VVEAALAEGLLDGAGRPDGASLAGYARRVAADPAFLPGTGQESASEAVLAALAVRVAVRRHARPSTPDADPRPLRDVALLVGSGGVLRHGDDALRRAVLEPLTRDHAGGWKVPEAARIAVDAHYVLFAAGLLADRHPAAAAALAGRELAPVPR
jgi:hypothetical protein